MDAFFRLAERDVGDACDLLHGVWEETAGRDGYVSIEVDPNLAYEREATFQQATELHDRINKPNLLVKIPGTEPGLGAIEDSIAAGRSINITLLFSLSRHKEVIEAYQRGIERLIESGGDPSRVASVASYFVSRVDTEADKRLDEIGSEQALALRGKLAIANAKLAYQTYLEEFSTDRWKALEEKGATRQRCLWASTSTKNPDYRDTLYVEELIGSETVNTMPEETIQAFQDHGRVAATLTAGGRRGEAGVRATGRRRRRLRRRDGRAGEGGRREVQRLLRGAARRDQGQARRPRVGMTVVRLRLEDI